MSDCNFVAKNIGLPYSTVLSELSISALPYSTALSKPRIYASPYSTELSELRISALPIRGPFRAKNIGLTLFWTPMDQIRAWGKYGGGPLLLQWDGAENFSGNLLINVLFLGETVNFYSFTIPANDIQRSFFFAKFTGWFSFWCNWIWEMVYCHWQGMWFFILPRKHKNFIEFSSLQKIAQPIG